MVSCFEHFSDASITFSVNKALLVFFYFTQTDQYSSSANISSMRIPEKLLSRGTICRCFKKPEDRISDVQSKSLGPDVVDELVMIVAQSPCLAKFLNCWNNTITGRLKDLGCKNMWSTWIHHNLPPNHDLKRLQILKSFA